MTLTQAAIITRRSILGGIVLTIATIVGFIGYNMWHNYYLSTLPPVEEKPEIKFGVLPPPTFPPSNVSSSNYSYSLDTTTGGLPQTPKLLKVYFIPQAGITLLTSEKSKSLAEKLGFIPEPQVLSHTQYRFSDGQGGNLETNLLTGNFSFQREVASSSAQTTSLSDRNQVANELKIYLESKGLLTEELRSGRDNVIFGGDLGEAKSAVVSLIPADVDKLPIVTATFNHGLVKTTINAYEDELSKFTKVQYTFWPIDLTTFSTYPLKSAEKALAELRAGEGYVSLEPSNPKVSISSVYLAYYQSEQYSPYLQPVFVFEGPGFAALIPAISQTNTTPSGN